MLNIYPGPCIITCNTDFKLKMNVMSYRAKAAFEQVRKEHETLKAKLETYFQVYLSRPTLTILHMFLAYFD